MKFFATAATAALAMLASPLGSAALASPQRGNGNAGRTTFVGLSDNNRCDNTIRGISTCGKTRLPALSRSNLRWAKVRFEGERATFWSGADCKGRSVTVSKNENCKEFPFAVRCVDIRCS